MRISRSKSWHWKVYEQWYRRKHGSSYEKKVINLCPYVRTVLLWSWLRWVLTNQHRAEVFWGAAVLAFPLALGRWFSLLGLYEDMAWLLFGALVLIAIQAVQDWSRERNKNRPEEPEKPREPKRPSPFHALVVAYIRSFHERICPLIEITD